VARFLIFIQRAEPDDHGFLLVFAGRWTPWRPALSSCQGEQSIASPKLLFCVAKSTSRFCEDAISSNEMRASSRSASLFVPGVQVPEPRISSSGQKDKRSFNVVIRSGELLGMR
jgi:hypothetical protein